MNLLARRAMTRFLLSPANCGGRRAGYLFREGSELELAARLRRPPGAPLGEVFSFVSGLYFRGKLAYAQAFAAAGGARVITTDRGLVGVEEPVTLDDLRAFTAVEPDPAERRYRAPLEASLTDLAAALAPTERVVFLGSIASDKYLPVLHGVLGERLWAPAAFTGRGDLSRGGLLLRAAEAGQELEYVPVAELTRRGPRPPRLRPRTAGGA